MMPLEDCRLVELPKLTDSRGALTYIEAGQHIPFDIRRIYYLYDIPADAHRGAHGHRGLQQLMIALHGSFDVGLDDGRDRQSFHLSNPCCGLFICPKIWRDITNISEGAVCLVLASEFYDESDYYRDYEQFLNAVREVEN